MKKLTVLLILVVCLGFAGCSKDAEVSTFMSEWESVTNEMSKSLEEGNVDEARKTFDAKKDSLKTKWNGVKDARGFQVSEDSKKKMEEGAKKNMSTITGAVMKGAMKAGANKDAADKMQALVKEYAAIFTM